MKYTKFVSSTNRFVRRLRSLLSTEPDQSQRNAHPNGGSTARGIRVRSPARTLVHSIHSAARRQNLRVRIFC